MVVRGRVKGKMKDKQASGEHEGLECIYCKMLGKKKEKGQSERRGH